MKARIEMDKANLMLLHGILLQKVAEKKLNVVENTSRIYLNIGYFFSLEFNKTEELQKLMKRFEARLKKGVYNSDKTMSGYLSKILKYDFVMHFSKVSVEGVAIKIR